MADVTTIMKISFSNGITLSELVDILQDCGLGLESDVGYDNSTDDLIITEIQ